MSINLYSGQMDALSKLSDGKILAGGVGSGKSIVALTYYFTKIAGGSLRINDTGENLPREKDVPLYIFTTAKKRDSGEWEQELSRFALERTDNPMGVTIDSWNNIGNYKGISDAFVIFDEQRLVGNGAWVKSFYKIAENNRWIMLSATPGDVWMDYVPVFIANGYYKNRTEFIRTHVVYNNFTKFPKIDRYVDTGVLIKLRRHLLVEIPFVRHTERHIHHVNVDYDRELFEKAWKHRWNIYEDQPIKDVSELFRVIRKVVNSDSSRTTAILKLLQTDHERLIIFYNFNYELELLRGLTSSLSPTVDVAEWNGQKHQPVPTSDSWLYLVQYTAGAEGWECITTNAVVFYSLNYSYKVWEQAMGRIDRYNTPFVDLYYYVLKSDSLIDTSIYKTIRSKKTFNEAGFMRNIDKKQPKTPSNILG